MKGRDWESRTRDTSIGLATQASATCSNRQSVPVYIVQIYLETRIEAATHPDGPVENSASGGVAETMARKSRGDSNTIHTNLSTEVATNTIPGCPPFIVGPSQTKLDFQRRARFEDKSWGFSLLCSTRFLTEKTRLPVDFRSTWVQDSTWILPQHSVPKMNSGSGQDGPSQRGSTIRTLPVLPFPSDVFLFDLRQ